MAGTKRMVRIVRSVTVTQLVDLDSYRDYTGESSNLGRQMSEDEILAYENGLAKEDQAQAIMEALENVPEEQHEFTCSVTFEEVPDEGKDNDDTEEVWPPGMGSV